MFILLFALLLATAHGLLTPHRCSQSPLRSQSPRWRSNTLTSNILSGGRSSLSMAILDEDKTKTRPKEPEDPLASFSFEEVLSPPRVDWRSVLFLLGTQGVVLASTTFLCDMLGIHPMGVGNVGIWNIGTFPGFDAESMKLALTVALPLIGAGVLVDRLPTPFFQGIARDTRFFTLRILGRASNPLLAMAVAVVLSGAAGYSEEFAFRGLLLNSLLPQVGFLPAAALSSLLFGLVHSPLFGASAVVETVLGGVFAYAYWASGFNLAVPIAVHTLYDFATLYFTWLGASADLKKRIARAERQVLDPNRAVPLPRQFEFVARAMFGLMDANGDGRIDQPEFIAGMRLFGLGSVPVGDTKEAKQMFDALDTNKDGTLSYDEYAVMFRDILQRWLTML